MKKTKTALSLAELIVAMVLLVSLSVFAISAIKKATPDKDALKFNHIYSGLGAIVTEMINDTDLYPDASGFANTDTVVRASDGKRYEGTTKFYSLFVERIGAISTFASPIKLPMYKVKNGENISTVDGMFCAIDSAGVTYCFKRFWPEDEKLESIYINLFMTPTYTVQNAIFIKLSVNGKLEIPVKVDGYVDCTKFNKTEVNHVTSIDTDNAYMQCKIIAALEEL